MELTIVLFTVFACIASIAIMAEIVRWNIRMRKIQDLIRGDDVSFEYDGRTFYGYFLSHKNCRESYVSDEHGKRYIIKTKKLKPQ